MSYDTNKLLPDESNLIRSMLSKEWHRQQMYMEIISDNLRLEYSHAMQRACLDSYSLFKRCLKDLSCIADTLRKFGIDKKMDATQSAVFMRLYADVIHTVDGWNEYKLTLPDCLNVASFSHDEYVRWKDNNIRLWAFEHGTDAESQITEELLIDDY